MDDWEKELERWKRIAGVDKISDIEDKQRPNISQIIKDRGIKLGSKEYMDLAFGRNPKDMSMPAGFRGRVKKR
jgi:hypothetical protein